MPSPNGKIYGQGEEKGLTDAFRVISHMATMGFRAPRHLRKYIICTLFMWCVVGYTWITFNGGIIPAFLYSKSKAPEFESDVNLLDFFPEVGTDSSQIIWGCQMNTKEALIKGLKSDIMMLEGDVMLYGQNTEHQQLVPVMANPPDNHGDLTFDQWFVLAIGSRKGIKLEFKSIEAVELTLQTMNKYKPMLHVPIWLHADILEGPNAFMLKEKRVDALRFIRLVTNNFPKCTLSLGWQTGVDGSSVGLGYDWTMVKEMHDLVEYWKITQPVIFSVRAIHVVHSLPQLKWLMEMTGGSLSIFSEDSDQISINDLLYIRYKLPSSKVFYDLPEQMKKEFSKVRHQAASQVPEEIKSLDSLLFKADQWKIVKSKEGETIYLGTETVMLRRGLLITKQEYKPKEEGGYLTIRGRVDFIESESKAIPMEEEAGIEIILHTTQATREDSLSGIKCFLGVDGKLKISTQSIPGADAHQETMAVGRSACANFEITDKPGDKISLVVTRPMDCSNSPPTDLSTGSVSLPIENIKLDDSGFVALRVKTSRKFATISQFKIIV